MVSLSAKTQQLPPPPRNLSGGLVLASYFDNLALVGWAIFLSGMMFFALSFSAVMQAEPIWVTYVQRIPLFIGAGVLGFALLRAHRRLRLLRVGHLAQGRLQERRRASPLLSSRGGAPLYKLIFEFQDGRALRQVNHYTYASATFDERPYAVVFDYDDSDAAFVLEAADVRPIVDADGMLQVRPSQLWRIAVPLLAAVPNLVFYTLIASG